MGGAFLTVGCLGFVVDRLLRHASQLPPVAWSARPALALAAASALVVAVAAVQALAWRTLFRAVAPATTWRESFALYGRSQLAKYLPGNVFHYVQRVALARGSDAGLASAAAVTLLDAVLVAVAAALVAVPVLPRAGALLAPVVGRAAPVLVAVSAVVGLLALGLLAWPRARGVGQAFAAVAAPGRVAAALGLDVLVFAAPGFMLDWLQVGFWPGAASVPFRELVPGFALAFLAGYVVPGAPGGTGLREAVLYGLFAPRLGGGIAAGLFLLSRVAFVLGDLLTWGVARLLADDPERAW